jgi:type I restriction enzyme S subunit
MSDAIPHDWRVEPLGKIAQVVSGGTPSRFEPEFWQDGTIPWITPTDITRTTGRYLSESNEHITELGLRSCGTKLLPSGTLLMTSRATLGELRISTTAVCTNQGFKSLVPVKGIDAHFLYYQLDLNKERYGALGIGSTFFEVNKKDTEKFELLIAPAPEQRRIAEILSTLDETIEETEALIAKYQHIKAGLMHDLFTRGVTPDGKLRPTRAEAPQLYKESPLGWIPKEWEVLPLISFAASRPGSFVNGPFGSDLLTSELTESGIRVIYVQDVKKDDYRRVSNAHVTEEKANELAVCNVRFGDVLVAKVGDPPGLAAAYRETERAVVTQDVIRIRPADGVVTQFLASLLNSNVGNRAIQKITIEGTRARVSLTEFKRLHLPKPVREEQELIAARISAIQRVLGAFAIALEKLKTQKHGLMHDLLTGRVRVKVDG